MSICLKFLSNVLLLCLFCIPTSAGVFETLKGRAKNAHSNRTWHSLFSKPNSGALSDGNVLMLTMRNWRKIEYFGHLIAGHEVEARGELVRNLAQEHEHLCEAMIAAAERFDIYALVVQALSQRELDLEQANQIFHELLRTDNREPCTTRPQEGQTTPRYRYNLEEHEVDLMRAFAQRLSFDFTTLALLFGYGRCQEYTALLEGAVRDAGLQLFAVERLRFQNPHANDRHFVNDHVVLRFEDEATGERTIYDPWLGVHYPMNEIRCRLRTMLNAATLIVTVITLAKDNIWLSQNL